MKKTLLLSCLILLVAVRLYGQYYTNQNKVWAFGTNAGVTFTSGGPAAISTSMNTTEGCASVSDASGSLLFYTDGKSVYNSSGTIMTHGSSIVSFGTVSTSQAAVIVPVIGSASQYYLFSLEYLGGSGSSHLAYSIVDMSLSGGLGDLIVGSIGLPMASNLSEKMIAVAGNNCDIWLLTHRKDSAVFWAYDITTSGIGLPVVSGVGSVTGGGANAIGMLKVSPNRLKVVSQTYSGGHGAELFDFDPSTGIVSNCQVLDATTAQYGSEFSPDNSKLYANQFSSGIAQYDITLSSTAAIVASKTVVASGSFGDLKLAPDNKIYTVEYGVGFLDCITNPNASGTGCGYVPHTVALTSGASGRYGLPNIVISVYPADTFLTHHDTLMCIATGGSTTIKAHDTLGAGSGYLWYDGATTLTHSITSFGNYWVKIFNGCHLVVDTIRVTPLLTDTISGITTICAGGTTTLTASLSGGTWSSSGTGIATVGSTTGVVTGVSGGTVTISYNVSTGCPAGITITVNPAPTPITGAFSLCAGATSLLSDAVSGGSWSSSNMSVATVNAATGLVYGLAPGSTIITYSLGALCPPVTASITVYALPGAITGITHVCSGATTTLGSTPGGGTWSSSSTAAATVGTGGVVSGVSGSVVTITYTLGTGCMVTIPVTVNPSPAAISGVTVICAGTTMPFYDGTPGGTWSSSSAAATVDMVTGYVTGAGAGSAVITYTLPSGCRVTIPLVVNPAPAPITGTMAICPGAATILSDATAGGTWSSGLAAIASVDLISGTVTGGAAGITSISYTLPGGCATGVTVTVNPGPLPIVGTPTICAGAIAFFGDITGGGAWSSSPTGVATVDPVTGVVTGVSGGTATITYTLTGTGCAAIYPVTVGAIPSVITGSRSICVGLTTALGDADAGGTWSSGSTAVATVDMLTGITRGVAIGTAAITYTLPSGCITTVTVTVNSSPDIIGGTRTVCAGAATSLTDLTGGGTWSSGSAGIATVGSTSGIVSGLTPGTTLVTYSLGAGCTTTATVTVNPLPGAITGTASVCVGLTTTLGDPSAGGSWSTAGTAATVTPTGVVTGASAGPAVIIYTLPTGCATTKTVTVNPLPALIGGIPTVCAGATTTLTDATGGGTWGPATGGIATVAPTTGVVSGVAAGTAIITYTIATGCSRTATVTVTPLPAGILGSVPLCAGTTITLSDATTGGTWSTTGTIATVVPATGMVGGVSGGIATVTYTLSTGCSRAIAVTVNPLPAPIVGPTAVCVGSSIAQTDALTGGTWVSGTTSVATITAGGMVTGATTGTTTITYTLPTGCAITTTVTVSLSPGLISGPSTLCVGTAATLTDAVSGGVWSSSNTSIATIGSLSGTVTGITTGTTTITYSLGTGCTVTRVMTVTAAPAAITGPTALCVGSAITLSDATTGGTWSSAATGIATVTAGGVVSGISAGTDTILYSHSGCTAMAIITVNPVPSAITGASNLCAAATITLSDGTPGGSWGTTAGGIATVDAATGTVSGISGGTIAITYSLSGGCIATKLITVNPVSPVSGAAGLCVGTTTTLSDATTGGTWLSGTTSVATIHTTTGVVRGIGTGITIITYTTAAGCTATVTVTVNTTPSAITGNLHVCAGATTSLSDAAGGGTWSSGSPGIATAVLAAGIITGVLPGTSVITYSLGSGCTITAVVTVNPSPLPITGTGTVCVTAATLLSDATAGGTWSSGSTGIATIMATGNVTGVSAGVSIITYTASTGCYVTRMVTVNPIPSAITGNATLCTGLATALSDTTAGGTWSSSNTGVATISGTVTVTGAAPGVAAIVYTLPTGCSVSRTVTVNAAPSPIAGPMQLCIGSSTTLSDATGGGTWSDDGAGIAMVSPAGVVTGLGIGMAGISYTAGGCPAVTTVTVNALPGAITGTSHVCVGSAVMLSDLPGGGSWSSPAGGGIVVTDAATGIVTGIGAGTASVTYSLGVGCNVSTMITVNPLPSTITGATNVCPGFTAMVSDATGGGVWSCSATTTATVSPAGVITGITGGAATISYTLGTGCAATMTLSVTTIPPITGATRVCSFGDTAHVYDAMPGGSWSSSVVTVSDSGIVTGFSAGLGIVTYTLSTGCFVTKTLTVNPVPAAITGVVHFCTSTTTALSDATAGGVWSSNPTTTASVSATGVVAGAAAGIATVSYTLPATGCRSAMPVTVDPLATAGTITGASDVCVGATITLADTAAGGVWSPVTGSIATVSGAGVVTAIAAGADTIKYLFTNTCGTATAIKVITVNPLPDAGTITGTDKVCITATTTLADAVGGGIWSATTGNASMAAATGVVTGMLQGTDTIIYRVTNMCGTAATDFVIAVMPLPVAGTVTGTGQVCTGMTDTLTGTPGGGTWSSSGIKASVINGVVTGVSAGTDTIYYTITNECGAAGTAYPMAVYECSSGVHVKSIQESQGGDLSVFPNPNKGTFTVIVASATKEPVYGVVINVVGQKVKEFTSATNEAAEIILNTPPGVYFVSVSTPDGNYVAKVTIAQ